MCHTWTNSLDLRWLSFHHKSFGDDSKSVRQAGIEEKDVHTPDRSRFLLDGVKNVCTASLLGAITTFVRKVWSFHLDVKPYVQSTCNYVLFDTSIKLINHKSGDTLQGLFNEEN